MSYKNKIVVTQDPKNENSITLYRSNGDLGEMQFTYSFPLLLKIWNINLVNGNIFSKKVIKHHILI